MIPFSGDLKKGTQDTRGSLKRASGGMEYQVHCTSINCGSWIEHIIALIKIVYHASSLEVSVQTMDNIHESYRIFPNSCLVPNLPK